jgi:hypothetical protein
VVLEGARRAVAVVLPAVLASAVLALAGCSSGDAGPDVGALDRCPAADVAEPSALACQLRAGATVLTDAGTGGLPAGALADAGRRTEAAYRALVEHPELTAPVLAGLDPPARAQARHAVDAGRALNDLNGPPQPTLPAWRIVDPLPAPELRGYYDQAQQRFRVPWTVLAAVNLVETRMGRVVGLSSAGAQGPMQFMPATWAAYGLGGDVWDPRQAILGAANYLAANGGSRPGGLDRALLHYNNDVRYVRAVRGYAAMMDADPAAFLGLHAWPVTYRTTAGTVPLEPGYSSDHSVPVGEWLAAHPGAR